MEMESRLIGWCPNEPISAGDYEGPRMICPVIDCREDGKGHYLIKRRAWVCSECQGVYFQKKKPDIEAHECYDYL